MSKAMQEDIGYGKSAIEAIRAGKLVIVLMMRIVKMKVTLSQPLLMLILG